MYFLSLTIGAGIFQKTVSAGVSAAAWAVIGTCAASKLVPAVLAQVIVGFTNAFTAIDADRGPKELV